MPSSPARANNLQEFLAQLDAAGELRRIRPEVDPLLEVAAIAARVSRLPAARPHAEPDKSPGAALGGHALLFGRVRGSDFPVAINTFGSYSRVNAALGADTLAALAARVGALVKPEIPTTLMDKMKRLPELLKLASLPPRIIRPGSAPCQDVILEGDAADLTRLPIIQCWPLDGDLTSGQVDDRRADSAKTATTGTGRYITLGGVHTRHPDTGARNIGMYRVQVFGPRLAAMHWHLHHDGARHFRAYQARGQRMPIAIALGGEPVLPYCATAPLPPGIDELLLAGFLQGRAIDLVPCRTIPLEVPAQSEIIIEGWVHPTETLLEGPFGDHTGYYSLADEYPALHITAITHRRGAIYPTTVVGPPPMEDYYLGKATERIFLPLLQTLIPDLLDYTLPMSGAFHNCAYVKIKKEYAFQARRVMHAIWGAGQMSLTKFLIIVDDDVDIHDEQQVLFTLFSQCDPARDMELVKGPLDILDHAAPALGAGSKIGFDATRKLPGEGQVRRYPARLALDPATQALLARRWNEYGL